ncbi:ras-related protein Rab-17-like [Mauremys reevesii]|uniref:ras-related protein Rab-17-like n=1 Tax=Mauremys reevesii TaxID=260615 RepID=UPI00193F05B3|nr:ras-related protein Rab-17-like [Mauremys reevesii]
MAPRRTQQVGVGPSTEQDYISKVVLLGSAAVGKSSTAFRCVKNDVRESVPTVGCSFFTQLVCLETATIKLEIWDTAGQEKYHSICHLYYRGADAALLVYDIARKEAEEFAKSKSLISVETSTKSNHQVTEVFMAIDQFQVRSRWTGQSPHPDWKTRSLHPSSLGCRIKPSNRHIQPPPKNQLCPETIPSGQSSLHTNADYCQATNDAGFMGG